MTQQRTHTRLERQKVPETPWSEQPSAINTPEVPASVYEVLGTEGQSLDSETLSFMEPRFGHDFSQVRIHADERAAESAQAVNARAYTLGQDVVFGQGQYRPGTTAGKRLLSHELTHTIQQQQGTPQLQ